jgi:uncharacterized protein YacL
MKPSEILKTVLYGILFGLMGFIIGIWFADLLYSLILKNMARLTTTYISLIIIILITVSASLFGFTKGKSLLE